MTNEEEETTKTKRTSKDPVEIKPDPELRDLVMLSKPPAKNKGNGSK
jgi:hypothetical protein